MLLGPLYAVTDSQLLPGDKLFQAVEAALRAGVTTVQLRDKTATDAELKNCATQLVQLCKRFGARCIINDRVYVAQDVGAHGVHLGQDDGSVADARRVLGDRAIIGVTCHNNIRFALRAQEEGASYVAFGRFFPSNTKTQAPPADINVLRQARHELLVPIVAIGGIRQDNVALLISAGAHTVAVCHSIFGTGDVGHNTRALLDEYRRLSPITQSSLTATTTDTTL